MKLKLISIAARFVIFNLFKCTFMLSTDIQSEINNLNKKISDCKNDTRKAKGFRKAIKAIKNAVKIA